MSAVVVRKFEGVELSAWGEGYLVRDTEVAKWLRFDRPENIRKLIRVNAKELNDYGVLFAQEETPPGFETKGGRPATVYYLNKDQALVVAMLSRAPGAAEVRRILTKAFDASKIEATDSFIFNQLFLSEPKHTEYLWSPQRLGPIARLYGVKYVGGRPPLETKTIQRHIYGLLLGHAQIARLRDKYPDPPGTNGEPYIYDHFHPEVRKAFESQLDLTVLALARSCGSAAEFRDKLSHEYSGRPLQLSLVTTRPLKPPREPTKPRKK